MQIKDAQNSILQYKTLLWKCGRNKFKWIKEITVTWKHLFEALIWIHLQSFWWQSILNTECSAYICISYDLINRNASAKTTTAGKLHVLRIRISPMWFADSRGNRMQHFCGDCNDRKCFIICLIKSSPTNMISLDKLFISWFNVDRTQKISKIEK